MELFISDPAKAYFLDQLLPNKHVGLMLGVRKAGCSGYAYTLEEVSVFEGGHHTFELGSKEGQILYLFVSDQNLQKYLKGTRIEWEQNEISSKIVFHNPNAEVYCGCGESFYLNKESFSD